MAAVGKWLARQALAMIVVAAGVFAGWMGRKWTGPVLVSEALPRQEKIPARPGGRPAPLREVDPVAAALRQEIALIEGVGQTLEHLQAALASGAITHFKGLALDLLGHPFAQFRAEALQALANAWQAADPAGFLDFIEETGEGELARAAGSDGLHWRRDALSAWAAKDPEGLLDHMGDDIKPGGRRFDDLEHIVSSVLRKGDVRERMPWLVKRLGESVMAQALVPERSLHRRSRVTQEAAGGLSAEEWRQWAVSAQDPKWAAVCAREALVSWRLDQTGNGPKLDAMREWLGPLAELPNIQSAMWWRISRDEFVERAAEWAAGLTPGGSRNWDLLQQLNAEQAATLLRDMPSDADTTWIHTAFSDKLMDADPALVRDVLKSAKTPEQRKGFLSSMHNNIMQKASQGEAGYASAMKVTEFLGPEGEVMRAVVMAWANGPAARQVPEDFARQTPSFQAAHRLDIAVTLAQQSPEAAAAIWAGAGPEELARPGASVVAEEIASRFLNRDSETASAWIAQLPSGVSRDRAVARMIEESAADDPQTCAQWLAEIHDATARERAAAALAQVHSAATQGGLPQ